MTVLFATVGYTPEKVTHALTREAGVESVTLFFGAAQNRATARALLAIRKACKPLGLTVKEVEIGSAYDFTAAVLAYRQEVRAHTGKEILFNLSGGTGVMQAAAAFVCFTGGIASVYYNREEKKYVRMPRICLTIGEMISPQQRRIVDLLLSEPKGLRPSEIATKLRLRPSNLDYHLKRLLDRGLVLQSRVDGKRHHVLQASSLSQLMDW